MSAVETPRSLPSTGGSSLRPASQIRRVIGGLSLFALFLASPARSTTAPPTPSTPTDALSLLQWCWNNRDMAHYPELFSDNYQFYFDAGNVASLPYLTTPWSRSDELISASNLFLGGGTSHAPASIITFAYTSPPTSVPNPGGVGYPWHQRFEAPWTLDITCTDGKTLHGEGLSKWILVRGDSAVISADLKARGFAADSTRWYIERWLEQEDTAPIVRAPSNVDVAPFTTVNINVSAWDPDGDPITSLIPSESGFTPNFFPNADNSAGTFIWAPLPIDAGPHTVIFTASNSLLGLASTNINVLTHGNHAPIPALVVTPPSGVAPLSVTADASHSTATDNPITSYKFDFGDGVVAGPQPSPTATHTYARGNWIVTLVVADNAGNSASTNAHVTVTSVPPLAALTLSPTSGVAPLAVTADASQSSDPDGQVATYQFNFGDGTVVGPQAGATAVHTFNLAGVWPVTVSVTDNSGFVATAFARDTVTAPGSPPVAELDLSPSGGVAPLSVIADGSHSTATGPIASYRFDFGDGTVVGPQTNPQAARTYAAGNWTATLTITDSYGRTAVAARTILVTGTSDPIQSLPNLVHNSSFEVDTWGWESFYGSTIARVPGGYDGLYALQMTGTAALDYGFGVNDHPDWIHPTTVPGRRYRYSARVRSAMNHGTARIRVREYLLSSGVLLGQISSPGVALSPDWQQLTVDYTNLSAGSSLDLQVKDNPYVPNEVFLTDDISIRDITGVAGLAVAQGAPDPDANGPDRPEVLSFRSTLYPSPVRTSAFLTFATTRVGALRVDVVDLAGREVRHVDEESGAAAGMHTFTIDRTGDDGQPIRPGLYFYRISADEGQITGRFVLLN